MKRNTNVRMKLKGVTGFCLLFLFIFLFVSQTLLAVSPSPKPRPKGEKIVLKHADKVHFDQYKNPGVQIFIGNKGIFMNHIGTAELETHRLILKKLSLSDPTICSTTGQAVRL